MRHGSRLIALAVSSVALATTVFSVSAGAGVEGGPVAPLTVVKTVTGPVPAGTTFTATIQCDGDIIDIGPGTDTATVTFDATGQPTSADTVGFNDPGTCTVTETASGGAATTTYTCEGTVPDATERGFEAQQVEPPDVCDSVGPQATPITVNIFTEVQTATVTINNTFVAPTPPPITPAAQIVAQPTFTG